MSVSGAVWLCLALWAAVFATATAVLAIKLTRRYAKSKADTAYQLYATLLCVSIVVIIAGAGILYLAGWSIER